MPYTLLLADDSVTIQRVIELTFADEDVTVIAVSDGDQAIARLEASPPDIVLADIGMPGKNGYEVAQYMRQSPKLAHIPVVLLTGAFEPVDQARANDAGCDGVLAKPFEPQLVIGRVKELLARSQGGPEASAAAAASDSLALPTADSIWAPLGEARASTFVDPKIANPQTTAPPRAELNDYFDRLDAAFSTLSPNAPPPAVAAVAASADPPATPPISDIDWFGSRTVEAPSTEPWNVAPPPADVAPMDLPLVQAAPAAGFAAPDTAAEIDAFAAPDERFAPIEESAPIAAADRDVPAQPEPSVAAREHHDPMPATPAPVTLPPPNAPLPALPDAFAALLASEQGMPATPADGLWPAAAAAPAPAITEEMLEDVTRRVLARLSDTVVREAVADIASKVAERLVREEIARIKASIK